MRILIDSPWDHTLCEDEQGRYLQVLCGSFALFEITFRLTAGEVENTRVNRFFLPFLVEDVRNSPERYSPRNDRVLERKVNEALKASRAT